MNFFLLTDIQTIKSSSLFYGIKFEQWIQKAQKDAAVNLTVKVNSYHYSFFGNLLQRQTLLFVLIVILKKYSNV